MNAFESYTGPTGAPEDCDPVTLPATTSPNCANDYNAHESEITDVWVSPAVLQEDGTYLPEAPPTDWTNKNSLNTTENLRHLTVIGDKPKGEPKTVALAKRWTKVVDRAHTMNLDCTDMSEENYEFIRTLQHGAKVFIWSWSYGDWVMGGEDGILCDVDAGNIWGRGEGTLLTGNMLFSWLNKYDPPAQIGNTGPAPLKVVKPLPGTEEEPVLVTGEDVTSNPGNEITPKASTKKVVAEAEKKVA